MGDILTQIQDELDLVLALSMCNAIDTTDNLQLLHMMSRSLAHIRQNAPPSVPPGQQRLDSFAEVEARNLAEATQTSTNPSQLTQAPTTTSSVPPSHEEFQQNIKEFARDTINKEQQIELLIANLPGLNSSEREQVQRMKELERQLEELEGERLLAVKEKETLLKLVEDKIQGVGRMR